MSAENTKEETRTATEDLWRLAETGDTHDLAPILAAGVEIDASDSHGITALMRAADHGRIEMVRLLLNHGADPNRARNDRFTPLMLAAFFGHEEIVKILVEHGADIDAAARFGTTAQHWAAARTFQDVVHYLNTTDTGQKLSSERIVEHSKSQTFEEANSAILNSNFTMPVTVPVHSVESLRDSAPARAVETPHELPSGPEAFENIPAAGVVVSQLQPVYRKRVFYSFATLFLAVGLFAGLMSGNRQSLKVVSRQNPAPVVVDPVVVNTNAGRPPDAKSGRTSDAKVETLTVTNDVNNAYEKPEKVNTSTVALATRGAVSMRNSHGSKIAERSNGATSDSQPLPSPGDLKEVRNAELSAAAAATAKPKPAILPEPTPKGRPEPATTQLLSPTRTTVKGRVIQWP